MPEGMPAVVKGPAYSGMMSHFAEEYGDAIEPLPTGATEEVAFNTTVTFGGVPFTFYKGASNDFPVPTSLSAKMPSTPTGHLKSPTSIISMPEISKA